MNHIIILNYITKEIGGSLQHYLSGRVDGWSRVVHTHDQRVDVGVEPMTACTLLHVSPIITVFTVIHCDYI